MHDRLWHQRTAVQRTVHEHEVAGAGVTDGSSDLAPLRPLPERVDRTRELGQALRFRATELGERDAREPRHLLWGDRANVQLRPLDGHRLPAGEPHPRRPERGDLERTPVGHRARPPVHRPDDPRVHRCDRGQLERVGVPGHDQRLVQAELTLEHVDVGARPLEQVHHERGRFVEPVPLDEVEVQDTRLPAACLCLRHASKGTAVLGRSDGTWPRRRTRDLAAL